MKPATFTHKENASIDKVRLSTIFSLKSGEPKILLIAFSISPIATVKQTSTIKANGNS